ncbi:hypothetical protein SK128_009643 [Halocaridina rubra]|uniref:Uncharacterized protein n=1 Tax=Halocaridina rubra TaxID=373956 RepID=A0AAN9A9F9_HALRR
MRNIFTNLSNSFYRRTSSPALMRLKMIVKLSKILGKDVATLKGRRPRVVDTRARPAMQNRKNKLLKKMQVALGKKSKPKKPNKNLKDTKYWRKFVEQKPMPQAAWRLALEEEEPEPAEQEPEVQIPLNSTCISVSEEIIYNHEKGSYEHFREDDPLLNLLTIPSRIYFIQKFEKHEKENATKQPKYQEQTVNKKPKSISDSDSEGSDLDEIMEEIKDDSRRELEAMYQGQISKEELAKLDSQPNPFNFSDRVTQTTKIICKEVGMQTKPPPSTSFIENVGLGDIYHNYQEDYAESKKKAKRRKEEEAEKERGHK